MSAPLLTFRVHFGSGGSVDVSAATPAGARIDALRRHPGEIITKIKVAKDQTNG